MSDNYKSELIIDVFGDGPYKNDLLDLATERGLKVSQHMNKLELYDLIKKTINN